LLPKRQRIVDDKEIKDIIRGKEIYERTPTLNITARKSSNNRFLAICTKKLGNSVKRNRIKRVLCPIFSENSKNMSKNLDIIINIRQGENETNIKAELRRFMAKW
jgi:ribonuclease P protein component